MGVPTHGLLGSCAEAQLFLGRTLPSPLVRSLILHVIRLSCSPRSVIRRAAPPRRSRRPTATSKDATPHSRRWKTNCGRFKSTTPPGLASLLPTIFFEDLQPLMALSNMFLWLVLGTAAGFHVLPGRPSTLILSLQSENSEAFPFLKRPEKLDGAKSGFVKSRAVGSLDSKDLGKMIGDVGFDPT